MNNPTTHTIIKSKQPCFIIPWQAPKELCPYPSEYVRVGIPRKTPKNNLQVDIQVVRLSNLRKQIDNTELPKGKWVNLT